MNIKKIKILNFLRLELHLSAYLIKIFFKLNPLTRNYNNLSTSTRQNKSFVSKLNLRMIELSITYKNCGKNRVNIDKFIQIL